MLISRHNWHHTSSMFNWPLITLGVTSFGFKLAYPLLKKTDINPSYIIIIDKNNVKGHTR